MGISREKKGLKGGCRQLFCKKHQISGILMQKNVSKSSHIKQGLFESYMGHPSIYFRSITFYITYMNFIGKNP